MDRSFSHFEEAIRTEGQNRYLIKLLSLTVVYILAAKLGLSLAFNFDQITTVWPPTGLAISALLLWGYHYRPGIFAGAFAANAITGVSPTVASGIALGNTLEAIVAVLLIKKFIDNGKILESIYSATSFIFLAGFLATAISASIGVSSLVLGGEISLGRADLAWLTWWVGDMMGALILVPLFVAWTNETYRQQLSGRAFEAIALFLMVITASLIIFSQPTRLDSGVPLAYLAFPVIVLCAVRFSQIGAVSSGFIIAFSAIWGTLADLGPFASSGTRVEQRLLTMHFFILVLMITALVLSVAIYERIRVSRALTQQSFQLKKAHSRQVRVKEEQQALQREVEEAAAKINAILTGIVDEEKPSRKRKG